ncbi:CLUMA_CG019366, isoform A [Clunio marinus]|uniref:CLUMA_CG019366, isoform A n=1 Tax=Clunio marinus TaxID=568069 RepID=A0A1J1J2J8_9DIPT|nr:CLUMA_CG019366, isoform A [Clunio marinus]
MIGKSFISHFLIHRYIKIFALEFMEQKKKTIRKEICANKVECRVNEFVVVTLEVINKQRRQLGKLKPRRKHENS